MASNGPYYQSVQPDHQSPPGDDVRIPQTLLDDYGPLAPQASMYPDPNQTHMNNDYHNQQLVETDAEDHAQLQGLVEAATSAAAQEQIRQRAQLPSFATNQQDAPGDATEQDLAMLLRENERDTTAKRKRSPSQHSAADPTEPGATATSDRPKRQKRIAHESPVAHGEADLSLGHLNNHVDSPHHLDARAAGVHSAAALFRPPSDSSKKYTRPPMSKLFTSLELSPENFLYLQAAAKQYMLDPEHPDRQACVGNRGKGDSEMVKLRLIHCVADFLEKEGCGEKYFGVNAAPPDDMDGPVQSYHQRKFVWPKNKDRIIALCTPLLRRMVTNERQRQYAIESRKGVKPDRANRPENEQDADNNPETQSLEPSLPSNPYDPNLPQGPSYQVYMLSRDTKQPLRDRQDFAPRDDFSWIALTNLVQGYWYESMRMEAPPPPEVAAAAFFDTFHVKLLTSGGLTTVSNEGEWQLACQDARQAVWLEGVIKVVVECAV